MANSPELVAFIYAVGGVMFLGGLLIGAVSTLARVLYYSVHGVTRPRLLTRDVIVYGGLALTFGLIAGVRLLPIDARTAFVTGNVGWALATTIPAVIAVITYVYYEAWVIERAKTDGSLALESSIQENITLTRAAGDKADAAYQEANTVNEKIATLTEALGHKEDKP